MRFFGCHVGNVRTKKEKCLSGNTDLYKRLRVQRDKNQHNRAHRCTDMNTRNKRNGHAGTDQQTNR